MSKILAALRAALAVHHTGTSDGAWDGPAAKANLKTDQDAAYYEQAFAWRDSAGDATKKASYKFIHHEVDANGKIGAANIKACQAGIAVLNGGRGGTTIPSHDRQGVYNHLAAHLRDAKLDPAPLRAFTGDVERRVFAVTELRVAASDAGKKIVGHAAVFNSKTTIMGMFQERIAPGAFAKSIQESDVRALFNHDPNYVLGRNKAGTLELSEDDKGLRDVITPPDTGWARDLMTSIERGDITQQSFAFRTVKDSWAIEDGMQTRTLHEVRLFDVSPVTYPAYEDTDCGLRAAGLVAGMRQDLGCALVKLRGGHRLDEAELDLIRSHVRDLEQRLDGDAPLPEDLGEAAAQGEPGQSTAHHSHHDVDVLRRRLDLAEKGI